jgi:hypothetical protein
MWNDPAVQAVLSVQTLSLLWLGAFLGGMASGAAGFAYGVVATAIWLHALTPLHAAMLVVSGGLMIQSGLIWPMRRSVDMRRLSPFLVGGLVGVPIGVALLVWSAPGAIKTALAAFLVLYGIYALTTPKLPRIERGGRLADAAVGFIGGVLGGVGGLSGVAPAIWTQLRDWPKDVARAVYQPFILMAHLLTLTMVGVVTLDRVALVLFMAAAPALLLGAWVGWRIYGRLDEARFKQALAALLIVSGLLLVL